MTGCYSYTVRGRAAGGQTWTVSAAVTTAQEGDFPHAMLEALRETFHLLTQGKAVYGQPGVGCHGPYTIDRFEIVREEAD
jgi:hypothetical protein